jgi:tRNA U34 2-thiouridine synthase MnmA/TrmU
MLVFEGTSMLENLNGKLLVYASSFTSRGGRLKSVSTATARMAKMLNLNVEVVTFREKFAPIYVYYKNGEEEPIPIYCNKNEKSDIQEICASLRKMMFVLSFHPKHSALKRIRKEIIRFS